MHLVVCNGVDVLKREVKALENSCCGGKFAAEVDAQKQVRKPGHTQVIVAEELDFSIRFVER